MRIAFVIQGLTLGGAERNLLLVAEAAREAGHEVTIVTFDGGSSAFPSEMTAGIRLIPLDCTTRNAAVWRKPLLLLQLVLALRRTVRSIAPDAAVSFMDQANCLTLIALFGTKIPVVISERVNPARASMLEGRTGISRTIITTVRNIIYRCAERLVVQTERAAAHYPPSLRARIAVVPNPAPEAGEPPPMGSRPKIILAVGRLNPQKRFDLLIAAFGRIAAKFPSWRLRLIGGGALKDELSEQAQCLGISSQMEFAGPLPSPAPAYRDASLFVSSSDYEGFPTALLEALASGLPVVATDCDFGPREILAGTGAGALVPCGDVTQLSAAIEEFLSSPERLETGSAAALRAAARYNRSNILSSWLALIAAAAHRTA